MDRPAVLRGAVLLPIERINLPAVKRDLTVLHAPMGEEPVEVFAYRVISRSNHVRVPRQYGLKIAKEYGIEIDDKTSLGFPATFPKIPEPRAYQVPFIEDCLDATEKYYDFIAKAHTGFGKTISSLIIAMQKGVSILVIVDMDNLKDQWLEPLKALFGLTIENGGIGIIQGPKCDYKGKPVTLAMVQTLSQKTLAPEVYDAFGYVIFDEVHIFGAPTFSQVLQQFNAAYRLGVSATPKRRDGLNKLIEYNLGKVRVSADKEHAESSVYIVKSDTVYSWYGNISPKTGRIITEVSQDGARNLLISDIVMGFYETERDAIMMGDRIEHLNDLMSLLYYLGVEEDEMGLYTGRYPQYGYVKNETPARRPPYLEKGCEYTPVILKSITKKMPKQRLQWVKDNAKLIFSTYGMTAKAFDVPRLCAGMDVTPRGTAEQIQGRILRELKGKKKPIWATIADMNNYRLVYSFVGRLSDYPKSNSRLFLWNEEGELTECQANILTAEMRNRVKELKAMKIVEKRNGTHTLLTQQSVKQQRKTAAIDTVKRIRSSQRS